MKKYLFLLGVLSLMPLVAQADMSLDINVPGVSLHLGDQDKSGNYWDGYDWRPPQWWHEHRGGISATTMSGVIIGMVAVGSRHQPQMGIIHLRGRNIMRAVIRVIQRKAMIITGMVNRAIIMGMANQLIITGRATMVSRVAQIIMPAQIIMAALAGSKFTRNRIKGTAD
ncbi:Protein of uncharacterised function (DUF2502) [Yersinia rohdei]|nr:Protein of uncharacterised function (DUF2502) [Yersinia rohdei]